MKHLLAAEIDKTVEAIRAAKASMAQAVALRDQLLDQFTEIDHSLLQIIRTDEPDARDVTSLHDRLETLRGRLNGMELGAYSIALNRTIEAAYQRLP